MTYFDSGNAALNPKTKAGWNPVTNDNLPIFACGISRMDQQDYMNCVNSY